MSEYNRYLTRNSIRKNVGLKCVGIGEKIKDRIQLNRLGYVFESCSKVL